MEREKFDFSNFSSFVEDGKNQNISKLEDYMKKVDKKGITYGAKLKIGDKVKLKGLDDIVIVKFINYNIPDIGMVDYAGEKPGGEKGCLCLFNQKDIECKVTKEEKSDDELEH